MSKNQQLNFAVLFEMAWLQYQKNNIMQLSSPHIQQVSQFHPPGCSHSYSEVPTNGQAVPQKSPVQTGESGVPNRMSYEDSNNIERINNEYMVLKNRVESRIKDLEEKCLAEDPSHTRVTLNMKYSGEYGDNWGRPAEGHIYHSPTQSHRQSDRPTSQQSNNHHHGYHHGHGTSINYHPTREFMESKGCQICREQTILRGGGQIWRPHCNSNSSNTSPYYMAPNESAFCSNNNLAGPLVRQQHLKTTNIPHLSQPPRNTVMLPVNSNDSGSNNNTTLNQNISEAILENLKFQKQISTNLKALSEKLSDFSVKRSESSGFLEDHYHQNREDIVSYRHQRLRKPKLGKNDSSRDYVGCWDCSHQSSAHHPHTHYHNQPPEQSYDRHPQKYADEGQDSSSEELQSMPDNTPLQAKSTQPVRINSVKNTKQQKKNQKVGRKKTSIFYPTSGHDRLKKIANPQSRAKSVSNTSSSKFRNKGLQALNGVKNVESSGKQRSKKKEKGNFQSQYFTEKQVLRHDPGIQKQKNTMMGRDRCPLHAADQILELFNSRQRNKKKQVYKDSQHRNRKHEKDHMSQSFQQQEKLRKQLLSKIAKNFFNVYGVK